MSKYDLPKLEGLSLEVEQLAQAVTVIKSLSDRLYASNATAEISTLHEAVLRLVFRFQNIRDIAMNRRIGDQ